MINLKLINVMMFFFLGLIGFLCIFLIMFKIIFLLFKVGIGNKLIIFKFIDNMVIKNIIVFILVLDVFFDNLNIMIGLFSLFKLKFVNSELSVLKICVVLFKVF